VKSPPTPLDFPVEAYSLICKPDVIANRQEFIAVVEEGTRNKLGALKSMYTDLANAENPDDYSKISQSLYGGALHAIDNIAFGFSYDYRNELDKPSKWHTISTWHSFRWEFKFGYLSKKECMRWLSYCSNIRFFDLTEHNEPVPYSSLDYGLMPDFIEDADKICEKIMAIEQNLHDESLLILFEELEGWSKGAHLMKAELCSRQADYVGDMSEKTCLESEYLQQIMSIINSRNRSAKAWLFGSRAKGTHKPTSDIDIIVDVDTDNTLWFGVEVVRMNRDCENTEIPYFVDIHCWHKIDETWKPDIEKHWIPLIQ